jgi:hypothetical protein
MDSGVLLGIAAAVVALAAMAYQQAFPTASQRAHRVVFFSALFLAISLIVAAVASVKWPKRSAVTIASSAGAKAASPSPAPVPAPAPTPLPAPKPKKPMKPTSPPAPHPGPATAIEQLGKLMKEGDAIRDTFVHGDDTLIVAASADWSMRAEAFLDQLGPGYREQFDAAHGSAFMGCPVGRSADRCGYYQEIRGKEQFLSELISDLRRQQQPAPPS